MANPSFRYQDGTNEHVWTVLPSVGGDRADLTVSDGAVNTVIEIKRNQVIIARKTIVSKDMRTFLFRNAPAAMVTAFKDFTAQDQVRLYPDSALGGFTDVYWISAWLPRIQRGGGYNFTVTILEV